MKVHKIIAKRGSVTVHYPCVKTNHADKVSRGIADLNRCVSAARQQVNTVQRAFPSQLSQDTKLENKSEKAESGSTFRGDACPQGYVEPSFPPQCGSAGQKLLPSLKHNLTLCPFTSCHLSATYCQHRKKRFKTHENTFQTKRYEDKDCTGQQ